MSTATMRMIDPILMEFDREAATTRKLLERVPEAKLDWAPHQKSMTLGKLAQHVATLPKFFTTICLGEGFDFADAPPRPDPPKTTAELLAVHDDSVRAAKANMAKLDDAAAMGSWSLKLKGQELLTIPRIGLVRNMMMNHVIHHRGQLSVYLRLLDVPLPPMYGPTADENPFG